MVQTKGSAIHNVRVESITRLDPPSEYWRRYPLPDAMREQVAGHRRQIEEILSGVDGRMLMIVGRVRSTTRRWDWTTPAGWRRWLRRCRTGC